MLKRVGIRTSYFTKYKGEHGVSIALYTPKWYYGKIYLPLAPSPSLLKSYKSGEVGEKEYEVIYKTETLDKLDPREVYRDLEGTVLLCYEKSTDFCHRHLVAKWLEDNLNIKVREC